MEINPYYNSLGRKQLYNAYDKYGAPLCEIRLDGKRRIAFVERGKDKVIWLRICTHDELNKKGKTIIRIEDEY